MARPSSGAASTTGGTVGRNRFRRLAALAAGAALVAAACGGDIDVNSDAPLASPVETESTVGPTEVSEPTATPVPPEPTATPEPEGTIEDVSAATVKIITERNEWDPFTPGPEPGEGIGTGFIINSDGVLITNMHIYRNGTNVKVFVEGLSQPVGATVIGQSECNDLIAMDLDGEGYDYLDFRTDEVRPGLTVYAAGFPTNLDTDFDAVDYTLTAGIVSTLSGSGDDLWVSVNGVIEHDARIRGGNSGGPLVDERGDVVGINFAGDDINDLNFAIDAQRLRYVIDGLLLGDVESIGIDGIAGTDGQNKGIWVSSVRSGTSGEAVGLIPGDLIVSVDGVPISNDRPMGTWCDALRAAGDDGVLPIEVFRSTTRETWAGEVNGAPLVMTAGPAPEVDGFYEEYEFIADDSGQVGLEVPVEWVDRDGTANEAFGPSVWASPNLEGFQTTWGVPGVILEASADLGPDDIDDVLDGIGGVSECVASGREDFTTEDGTFVGKIEFFTECDGTDAAVMHMAATRPDGSDFVRMIYQAIDNRDGDAADVAIATFDAVLE